MDPSRIAVRDEQRQRGEDLVICDLGLRPLDTSCVDADVELTVVDRKGKDDRDLVDAVLSGIADRDATRLVIGIRRRTPVAKAILGSVSQRLLLQSPVPVLAVKVDDCLSPPISTSRTR